MEKILYILCGPAASGKSTFCASLIAEKSSYKVVSRDAIRVSLLEDKYDYFAKEDEVYKTYLSHIQDAINSDVEIIVADATHLSELRRNRLLDSVDIKDYHIIPVNFLTPLDVCIKRNKNRSGLAHVPEDAIKKHFRNFTPATYNEKHYYSYIINVEGQSDYENN